MSKVGAIRIPTSNSGDGSSQSKLCSSGDESSPSERPSVHDGFGEGSKCDAAGGRESEGRYTTADMDESVHLRRGRESERELHVDIWSGSIPSRLSSIGEELAQSQANLTKKKDSLCTYIMRSSKSRLKLVRSDELHSILSVLHLEIAIATARNRPDLIDNLLIRRKEFIHLFQEISNLDIEDYQLRFDSKS